MPAQTRTGQRESTTMTDKTPETKEPHKVGINKAELMGIQLAQANVQRAKAEYTQVLASLGLNLSANYQLEEDGDAFWMVEVVPSSPPA